MFRALAIVLCKQCYLYVFLLMLSISNQSYGIDLNIGIDEVDSEDIDILVGSFSSLVGAFEKFATDENSILEQRIDQIFDRFDASMQCGIDQLLAKGKNSIEGSLPSFVFFRSSISKTCNKVVLKPFGTGGTLDRTMYESCVLKEYIVSKAVSFKSVSSGYSGLKEQANAAYCQYKGSPDSADFIASKELFSNSNILTTAYAEIAEIEGCQNSDAESLYDCSEKYVFGNIEKIENHRDIDRPGFDSNTILSEFNSLIKPEKKGIILFRNYKIDRETLISYESVITSSLRLREVVELNRKTREEMYNKETSVVEENRRQIGSVTTQTNSEIYDGELVSVFPFSRLRRRLDIGGLNEYCGHVKWKKLEEKKKYLESYANSCSQILENEKYTDLVSNNFSKTCNLELKKHTERFSEILKFVEKEARKESNKCLVR